MTAGEKWQELLLLLTGKDIFQFEIFFCVCLFPRRFAIDNILFFFFAIHLLFFALANEYIWFLVLSCFVGLACHSSSHFLCRFHFFLSLSRVSSLSLYLSSRKPFAYFVAVDVLVCVCICVLVFSLLYVVCMRFYYFCSKQIIKSYYSLNV